MDATPIFFGIACAVALEVAALGVSRQFARYLVLMWALSNIAWLLDSLWLMPVMDSALGMAALSAWHITRAKWIGLLVHAIAVRLVLHILDSITGHLFIVPYLHALNATFVWMLVLVALGENNGSIADLFRHRLRWLRRLRGVSSHSVKEMNDGC